MSSQTRREVRLGLSALAVSGLLFAVGIVLRGPADLTDPGSCCRTAFSSTVQAAYVIVVVGAILLLYGFFGLYRYLTYRAESSIAFLAFAVSVAAAALFLPLTVFFAVSGPAIADLFQEGDRRVIAVVEANFRSALGLAWSVARGIAWIVGPLLFAVAVWRDGRLPRWTAALFALSFLLLIPVTFATEFLGAVLLLISAGTMVWAAWQEPLVP